MSAPQPPTAHLGPLPVGVPGLAVLESVTVGVTLVDPAGRLLWYNQAAAYLADRRPELVGQDVRACHQTAKAVADTDRLLAAFAAGRVEPWYYHAVRKGRNVRVVFTPIHRDGRFVACVQTIQPLDPPEPKPL